jgi:hypothetical protein
MRAEEALNKEEHDLMYFEASLEYRMKAEEIKCIRISPWNVELYIDSDGDLAVEAIGDDGIPEFTGGFGGNSEARLEYVEAMHNLRIYLGEGGSLKDLVI